MKFTLVDGNWLDITNLHDAYLDLTVPIDPVNAAAYAIPLAPLDHLAQITPVEITIIILAVMGIMKLFQLLQEEHQKTLI